jgi:hypothetical protein
MSNVVPLVGDTAKPVKDGADRSTILTQSEMSAFLRDRRYWYLAYYRALRKRHDHPYLPSVGNLYHAGLEAYYRDKTDPLKVVQLRAELVITPDLPEQAAESLLAAAELAGIMLEGYLEWLKETGADAHLKVLSAEEKVEVLLAPTKYVLRGKIDARAVDLRSEAQVQMEHKTVGNLTDLPKTAQSAFQFLTYDLLAYLKALEANDPRLRTDGVLLNMARRVKRTARANPPFYGRHEVRHNTQELRAHWRHIIAIGGEITRARERLDLGEDHHLVCPPTVSRDSSWSNSFFPVYPLMDDGSDYEAMLADLYEKHDPLSHYEEEDA